MSIKVDPSIRVRGKVTGKRPGGLSVLLDNGVSAFLSASAILTGKQTSLNDLIGKTVSGTVISSNSSRVVRIVCDHIEECSDYTPSHMANHAAPIDIRQLSHPNVLSTVIPDKNDHGTIVPADQKVKSNRGAGAQTISKSVVPKTVPTILSVKTLLTLIHDKKTLPDLSSACEQHPEQDSTQATDIAVPPDQIDIDKIPSELRGIAVSLDDNNCDVDLELIRELVRQSRKEHTKEIALVTELLLLYACARLVATQRLTTRYNIHLDDWRDRNRELLESSGLPSSMLSSLDAHVCALIRKHSEHL